MFCRWCEPPMASIPCSFIQDTLALPHSVSLPAYPTPTFHKLPALKFVWGFFEEPGLRQLFQHTKALSSLSPGGLHAGSLTQKKKKSAETSLLG